MVQYLNNGDTNGISILFDSPKKLEGLEYIITGFYGLGLCGYLTTKFLYDAAYSTRKVERLAIVWSDSLPPIVEVDDTGKFRYPIEIHKIDRKAAVLLFRYQPSVNIQIGVANSLTELSKENDITLILCGGIDINALPDTDVEHADVVYVCNKAFEEKYIVDGSWDVRRSPPEVVVSGGIALILMYADRKGVPAVSLLTPTIARTGYLDYRASLKLAKRIVGLFDMDLELSRVEERIQEIEAQRLFKIIEEREQRKKFEETEEMEEYGIT